MAGKTGGHENDLAARLMAGDQRALSRAITAVENSSAQSAAILAAVSPHIGKACVLGLTGPPGAGKSTLINALVGEFRQRGASIAIVAVDPSSPLTGGAILGDRIRMSEHAGDEGIFVRSLAARGHLGGLSRTAARIVDLMDAAGRDLIIVETVGTGQSEVEIAEIADIKIVIMPPGLGDDIQAIKAGVLEIADILVVNKSDLPTAGETVRQLQGMLALRDSGATPVPVLETCALSGEGVAALADTVQSHKASQPPGVRRRNRRARTRRLLARTAADLTLAWIGSSPDAAIERLCAAIERGEMDLEQAALELLHKEGSGLEL